MEWRYAQSRPDQQLAHISEYASIKKQDGREIEFRITVYEYVSPKDPAMPFFAITDKQTNQKSAPYTPCGWGRTLLEALTECLRSIDRMPYEGE